jgi:hypothetical protein
MEKNEVQKKTESAATESQGTATNGMEVRTQSIFSRAGSITMEKDVEP